MKKQLQQYIRSAMSREGRQVLGTWIDALFWDDAIMKVIEWGAARESRYICICNVHSVVTANHDSKFNRVVNGADMSTSDGAPIAWALRQLGYPAQERINGPDLMWRYLREAERIGQSAFFYGSTDDTLAKLRLAIHREFPQLRIAGMHSPPFRTLSREEDEAEVAKINDSGAHVVFVGLGCPKQEIWMADHKGRINAVMIGVGAAFDYHSGTKKRAPLWWQRNGLEWLYRLGSEPRRLMKRYLVTNTFFVFRFAKQLIVEKILNK
jgi:N-acetylglucosaminyldiphosphoundecaprenol N-acetyl-beta-D-mannosaminyltransferase